MIKRITNIFSCLLLLFLMANVSCHTPKTLIVQEILPPPVITLSDQEIPMPPLPAFEFIIPETAFEVLQHPIKNITLDFTSRDIHHIKSNDPLLFSDSNTEIIDLAYLSEEDYAFPLPGGNLISPYAGRRRNHSGVDVKTCANDTIVAAFDGVVRMAKPYAAYGNVIVIRHYNGLETLYSHNSKNLAKPGDIVKAGQPVALTGRTGRATTEHLHFETRINGQHFNPELVFDFSTHALQPKSLLCIKKGDRINVQKVDPLPGHLVLR